MTTVAANLRMMAADSMVSDDTTDLRVKKIEIVGPALVGCAGDLKDIARFMEWLAAGANKRRPKLVELEALVLIPDGLFYYNESCRARRMTEGFSAIGTGTQAAMAKLREGGGPIAAVRHAIRGDKNSGPPISWRHLRSIQPKGARNGQ